MLYVCFADGMADYHPNSQEYESFSNIEEMREAIRARVESFNADYSAEEYPYNYVIPEHVYSMMADRGASSLNWRLCNARNEDRVLDVIGMTEEEFEREAAVEF